MASLLNDLTDKLDAADNDTTEPDDPNNKDKDADGTSIDVY